MIAPSVIKIGWLAFKVIKALYPIGISVYEAYQGHTLNSRKSRPVTTIKRLAKSQGIEIGHTEAELVRSAIHYAVAKTSRQKELKTAKKIN